MSTPPGADGDQVGQATCRDCAGTGQLDEGACPTCAGTGVVDELVGDA